MREEHKRLADQVGNVAVLEGAGLRTGEAAPVLQDLSFSLPEGSYRWLLGLTLLAALFQPGAPQPASFAAAVLVISLPHLALLGPVPLLAGTLGWITTQMTVRRWLGQLP